MPSPVIRYPQSTFGYTGQSPASGSLVDTFESTGAIPLGAPVELDIATFGRVKATTAASPKLYVGIAQDAAAGTGEVITVALYGPCTIRVGGAVSAGDALDSGNGVFVVANTITIGVQKAVAMEAATGAGTIRAFAFRI